MREQGDLYEGHSSPNNGEILLPERQRVQEVNLDEEFNQRDPFDPERHRPPGSNREPRGQTSGQSLPDRQLYFGRLTEVGSASSVTLGMQHDNASRLSTTSSRRPVLPISKGKNLVVEDTPVPSPAAPAHLGPRYFPPAVPVSAEAYAI
jgi:hypothetical protein